MGKEGHPEFEYTTRKEDAFTVAEAHVKNNAGNKAAVVNSKTKLVIQTFHSETNSNEIKIHRENKPFTHRDGIHNLNRAPGITNYKWSSSWTLPRKRKKPAHTGEYFGE
jgi:hypothetical protein